MDAKKIAELKRSNAGWLTPDDELIACSLYNHIPELRAAGFRPDLFEAYDEAMENRAEEERDFIERYGDDEHIPWHCYGDGDLFNALDNVRSGDFQLALSNLGVDRLTFAQEDVVERLVDADIPDPKDYLDDFLDFMTRTGKSGALTPPQSTHTIQGGSYAQVPDCVQ